MKHNRKNPLIRLISQSSVRAVMGVFCASASIAVADNLTWDANGVAPTVTNGAGVWDTTSLQWWDGVNTVAWTNGSAAIIGTNTVAGAGGSISLVDQVNLSVSGLQVADNGNDTNHTVALPASGNATLSVGAGGIVAADGLTIATPVLLDADQSWTRNAGGNGALIFTGALDDNFVIRNLTLSSSLGSTNVGLILRGPGFHDGTTTINDGYFQIRHDALGISAMTLNATVGGAQRMQFVNAAGTGTSGTLSNPISVNAGKEGNFYIWGGFTTTATQAITGGDAASVIRKSDTGTLLLSANNTYSAQTIVDAGTLQLGNGGTTGAINNSASLAINGSGILSINRSGSINLSDVLPGAAGDLLAVFGAADSRLNYIGTAQTDTLTVDQDLGSNLANGQLRVSSGTMTLASGADVTMRTISVGHTTAASGNVGTLNVGPGVNVTLTPVATSLASINLGDSGGNAGIMNVTGGSVLTNSNATGSIRVGHFAGTGSVLNISDGSLSTPNGRLAIGWDGEGTLNMTGGTINAFAVSIDGNGAGPAAVANLNGGDLRIGGNGMNTLGQGTINANGGKITCTAGNTINVPRTMLTNGLTVAFGSATTNITITDNCVTSGSGPLAILNESSTGEKNYTINTSSPSYSGAVSVPNGVRLQLQQPNALGAGTATLVNGSGAFLTSSASPYPTNFVLSGNGWLEPSSVLAYGALRLQSATVSGNVSIAASGARITAHNGSSGTITGNLSGTGALEINSTQTTNNGTITLAGNGSSFTGPITVPQGRLNVAGSVGGNVSVIDGATLGGEGVIGGNLILGGSSPAIFNVNPVTAGALAVTGNVSVTGVTPVAFSVSPTATGTITLLTYSGVFSGTVSDLVIANESSYRTASITDTGSAITLNLSNKNLTWSGSVSGVWDLGLTTNWTDGAASEFYWADNVSFPDGASNTTITLAGGNLAPASITFPANSTAYTLTSSGTNQITGSTSLIKTGTALLTMAGANTYTGGTVLSKGETRIRTAGTLGTGTITLGDANTGANNVSLIIDTNRTTFTTPIVISNNGSGTMTLGSLSSVTGSGAGNGFNGITLQRDVIFNSNAADRTDYISITGTGNITVTGNGRTVLTNANTFVGNITVTTSTDANGLQLGTNSGAFNAIPDASNVTIEAGGKLSLSYTANGTETISGLFGAGTVRNNGGNANTLIVGGNNGSGNFSGTIVNGSNASVAFGLTKNGTGTQTLSSSASSYTGLTTINAGVLEVGSLANGGNNSSIGAAASNIIFGAPAATLRYIGSAAASTDRSFTLSSGTGGGATLEASGTGAWTIPAAIALNYGTVDQTRTLTLGGTGTAANTYAGTIANNGTTGLTSVVKSGTGTWALTANNSFTGPLTISGGRLNLSFIGDGGVASQVGQSTRVGSNLVINGGTLAYTGINATTDRGFSTGTSGGTIEIPAATTLTFGGASNGANYALNGTLTKTGPGTLTIGRGPGSSATAATDIVINEGVVNFSTGHFNNSPFGYRALVIAVNPGGILRGSASHALGGDNIDGGTSFGQIRLIGGEYNLLGSQYISGGTISGEGRLLLQGGSVTGTSDFRTTGSTTITSLSSATTSVLGNSGGISLQFGPLTISAADGAATTDLRITGPITSPAANTNSLTKAGPGFLELQGSNTFTGPTSITEGSVLVSGGHLRNTSGITLSAGTLLDVTVSNVFTTGHSEAESATSAITVNGGTLRFSAPGQNRLGNIVLNGGTLTANQGSGFGNGYDTYLGALSDANEATVSVTGTTASTINGSGVLRLGTNTIFDVSDVNPAGDDLTVSVGFRNQTLDQANAAGGFTKSGAGTMVLSGVSAHTGNTTVAAGQLILGSAGELRFTPTTNGVSNKVTGAGSATFNGKFNIILTGANTTVGNQWTLVDVASKSFGGTFAVTGFTKSGTVHTLVDGANTWTFEETTGVLKLQATVTNGYDAWKAQITNGKDLRTDDADDDGLTNLQEFLFGTSPIAATGSLTTMSVSGGNMTLTWLQRETGASYLLKESTTLNGWQNSDLIPTVDPNQTDVATDYDRWRVIIPMTAEKEFFRLEGTELP